MINLDGVADKADALISLRPNAQWAMRGDVLEWLDTEQTQPTDAEIDAEVIRLQAEYDAKQYARDRASAYPSMQDQLDMQYWDGVNGTTTWQDAIEAVKTGNPKP
jgi:type II secretory pathway component PulK